MSETTGILQLSALWQQKLRGREGRVLLLLVCCGFLLAAEVARAGTLRARVLAGALGLTCVTLALLVARIRQRRLRTSEGVLRTVVRPIDRQLSERALRASALVASAEVDPQVGSLELAKLHFRRTLERVPLDAVRRRAERRAARLGWLAFALLLCVGAVVTVSPRRPLEGVDVLFARHGLGAFPLDWLELVGISVQPPGYLRLAEQVLFVVSNNELPEGSVISVRGVPLRPGQPLVLTDGHDEVPFVPDGSGNLVAHWTLRQDASLRIAARFGSKDDTRAGRGSGVLIPESDALSLVALKDRAPRVTVEDAPRTVQLRDVERIEFRYEVEDDHGLREVDLVLRSASRIDRRVLTKLDGQSKLETGAHAIAVRDPFLRRMFLPVIATLEARDNDVTKPDKWGQSAPVTIMPPAVGEPQALRYRALEGARERLLDLLAYETESERLRKEAGDPSVQRDRDREHAKLRSEVLSQLKGAAEGSYAGLKLPRKLSAFVAGQARALEKATGSGRQQSEDVVLALDAGLRALSQRDAEEVSKRLGDVAEEVADASKAARGGEDKAASERRLDAALAALDSGTGNLVTLGALGADIGSVAQGDTRRIRRGLSAGSYTDAELAARHLAARLRRPRPSFGTASGGGSSGGVESGRGSGASGSGATGEASEADKQFDQLMRELGQLAAEHGQQISDVEQALSEAEQANGNDEGLKRDALEHANALRNQLATLPEPGAMPGSARSSAALARERLSAMAQQLERLGLKDAVENGQLAKSELEEAARQAKDPRSASDWLDPNQLNGARKSLDDALAFAQRALDQQRQQAAARAANALNQAAGREDNMARRAGNLAGRGEHSEAKLPDEMQESLEGAENAMRQAARELASGRGDQALDLQREAQRLLERADPEGHSQDENGNDSQGSGDNEGSGSSPDEKIPGAEKKRRAEDFRRRVLEGLSKDRRGRLSPAVTRYAEGLLE